MVLGAFLAAVGLGDLGRADHGPVSGRRQLAVVATGAVLLGTFLLWAGDSGLGAIALLVGLVAAHTGWVVATSAALAVGGPAARGWRTAAFASLGVGAAISLLGVGALEPWVEWPTWLRDTALGHWPAADVMVSAGAVLLQLATGNLLVRLVLDAVGVPAVTNEKRLKGGRLLGPMERIFIVGLGHIGEVTAAAIVVAAKGLLRFPEIQAGVKEGPSDVTEYFLIGSFTSWLIGLAGVALIYLA
ncbi:hypothetical protein E9934_16955 [Nocardioides caeni]|uniref:Uncharacterized protein n=2 Tax=Nocardioides caeni TaxID=574700 RepID=A0A4S8N0H7_9ACTN|nr:hypothetical protein E9934_16955 [Nocardioides caeni]